MAVRRPRAARKPRAPRRTPPAGVYRGALAEGDDLAAAAEVIADEARRLAAPWAKTGATVDSIHVEPVDERNVLIVADSGASYPAETRARHPLFGNREYWYGPPGEKFMEPAAEAKADDALKRWSRHVDRLLEKAGFRNEG